MITVSSSDNTEQTVLDIKKLHQALTGKSEQDILITYKGTSHGVTQPWNVRIDTHETNAATYDAAIDNLRLLLRTSLEKKAEDMARDAQHLRQIVAEMRRN